MPAMLSTLFVIVEIAFRNLFASKWKTLIVGGIIGFGAFLVVVGTSIVDGVDRAMRRSVTGSLSGHIQVYSSQSKGELELMGSMGGGPMDVEPLAEFASVRDALLTVPNVAAVVPMGVDTALVSSGNTVDQALSKLRGTINALEQGDKTPDTARKYEAQKAHVQQMVKLLSHELENAKQITERGLQEEDAAAIERAASDAFWTSFDSDRYDHLELLENKIASLASDADLLQLRYVGTDPQAFAKAFDRMQVVDGELIPLGKRGFMFSKYMYEEMVKLKTARGLDKIKQAMEDRKETIAVSPELQRIVRENRTGVRELMLQLDALRTEEFRKKLQGFLQSKQDDLAQLLASFFDTDDKNFSERYAFFYKELAPQLELYRIRIGDSLMIKTFTKSGYVQSANLKVYGTYTFQGLERSPQAGAINMMDMVSFRELYGFMTTERAQEIEAMRTAAGAKEVSRESAEQELFGAAPSEPSAPAVAAAAAAAAAQPEPAAAGGEPSDPLAALRGTRQLREQLDAPFNPAELQQGVALSAAIMVKDESKIAQTISAIEAIGKERSLPLKAITWQQASGLIGQFATLMRAVLYATVLIIFVVALVVINNALVMATLERVREFGTLRAVGAQRRFILSMLVLESIVIGVSSGAVGALIGISLLAWLGRVGIPAVTLELSFFFSGPRLFPSVTGDQVAFSFLTVLIVSVISSIYPAWLAMRVSPREAMSAED
jgi:ABC-type lipoprotein release transport system permease subunit